MPELPEVEAYRRLAEQVVGRTVARVHAPDAWYLKRGLAADTLAHALIGRRLTAARRVGKLLLLDTAGTDSDDSTDGAESRDGPTLGLRFGMTGRLVVDGVPGIHELIYSSVREEPAWDRFGLDFADVGPGAAGGAGGAGGGGLRVRDPRRLGGVELDPDESRLGADALTVTPSALRRVLVGSRAPLKARLMDQRHLAGVGNLIADEVLWRACLAPTRPAAELSPAEVRRLHTHLRRTVDDLIAAGGSHLGCLAPQRQPGGRCPRDGVPLARTEVGGRTTWWCPEHQR